MPLKMILRQRFRLMLFFVAGFVQLTSKAGAFPTIRDEHSHWITLVRWVSNTGTDTVIRAAVANVFNLGADDIAVRERGYRPQGDKMTHVLAVTTRLKKPLVFIAIVNEADGSGIVWEVNEEGPQSTAVIDPLRGPRLSSNAISKSALKAEEDYFFAKRTADPRFIA